MVRLDWDWIILTHPRDSGWSGLSVERDRHARMARGAIAAVASTAAVMPTHVGASESETPRRRQGSKSAFFCVYENNADSDPWCLSIIVK
jgi:hypothetical protein